MKNENFKTKLISGIMFLLLLLTSVLALTSCPGYGHRTAEFTCYSYDEMLEYATQHKVEFESDPCIFLLFDIDKYDNISTKSYTGATMWYDGWSEFLKLPENDKIADEHWRFSVSSSFQMDKVLEDGTVVNNAYDIECHYAGFADTDEIKGTTSGILNRVINSTYYFTELNRYMSFYSVFVDGNSAIEININHQYEATQEELDAIVQIFIDNAVIIR